jgi:hypothetical protein
MAKRIRKGPDGKPLQRFNITYRCRACAMKFKAVVYEDETDPPCPNLDCGVIQRTVGLDVAAGQAPAVGGSLAARATDAAAQMVMEDHKMTDLKDAKYEGETMAPGLTASQRAMGSMFDAQARKAAFGGQQQGNPTAAALNRIARGGMAAASSIVQPSRDYVDPIAGLHSRKVKPPIHVVNSHG